MTANEAIEAGYLAYREAAQNGRGYLGVQAADHVWDALSAADRKATIKAILSLGFDQPVGSTNDEPRDHFVLFCGYCHYGTDLYTATPDDVRRLRNEVLGLPEHAALREARQAIGEAVWP